MPYITREDGERFIIPSYRDVLSVKKQSLLRREVLLLASSYGEYITLQRKNADQYEVAFPPEPGCLLGEAVWHYFKRPRDLVYCEAIPNTAEAILVIVKSGSVYLDGSVSIDSIPEELVIFKTQHNNFDIYLYGDVPISETPELGKFTFDASSVKSFHQLPAPVFPTLPTVKAFQLQPVGLVLKKQGIGTFPLKKIITVLVAVGLIWMAWTYFTTHRKQLPQVFAGVVNPYQLYMNTLRSPDPADTIHKLSNTVILLLTMPGWSPDLISYAGGTVSASVKSLGSRTNVLLSWAKKNNATVNILSTGFYVNLTFSQLNRLTPTDIHPLKEVIANLIDRLSYVNPKNDIVLGTYTDKGRFSEVDVTINFDNVSPTALQLIGDQFRMLPLTLSKVSIKYDNGYLSGSIVLKALGN